MIDLPQDSMYQLAVRFRCVVCGKVCEQAENIYPGMSAWFDSVPRDEKGNWQRLNEVWICNSHSLEIIAKVDGNVMGQIDKDAMFPPKAA